MATMILAIDPGSTESGYAVIDPETRRPINVGIIANDAVLDLIALTSYNQLAIEMVASYGMAVGADVFETCVWIGRFLQHSKNHDGKDFPVETIKRLRVKTHHCHDSKANDSNITQALIDRFAPGVRNRGKGTKAEPGWFYGFAGDMWQAYALAVLVADTRAEVAA